MPRIQPVNPDDALPEVTQSFERFFAARGSVPNMFRTMALRPAIMATAEAHMDAIFETGTVEKRLKEMLSVRVSQVNDCMY